MTNEQTDLFDERETPKNKKSKKTLMAGGLILLGSCGSTIDNLSGGLCDSDSLVSRAMAVERTKIASHDPYYDTHFDENPCDLILTRVKEKELSESDPRNYIPSSIRKGSSFALGPFSNYAAGAALVLGGLGAFGYKEKE